MTAWFTVAFTHALAIRAAEERPSLISHGFRPSSWYYATAWSLVRGSISPMETSGRSVGPVVGYRIRALLEARGAKRRNGRPPTKNYNDN